MEHVSLLTHEDCSNLSFDTVCGGMVVSLLVSSHSFGKTSLHGERSGIAATFVPDFVDLRFSRYCSKGVILVGIVGAFF